MQNDPVMTEEERKEWKTKDLDGFDKEFAKIEDDLAPLYELTLVRVLCERKKKKKKKDDGSGNKK